MNTGFLIVISLFIFSSCNQSTQSGNTTGEVETIDDLRFEFRELGDKIDSTANLNDNEFQAEAKEVLQDFENSLEKFEAKLKEGGEEISEETKEGIDNLKKESRELKSKLDSYSNESEANMAELREEMKHDFSQFGNSVKDFFKDNE